MRRLVRQALVGAIVLLPVIGGIVLIRMGGTPSVSVAQSSVPNAFADFEARRAEMDNRISEGRRTGKLGGMSYLAVLDEQHRILVKQKRFEAQGLTEDRRRELTADLDRASSNIDKYLAR